MSPAVRGEEDFLDRESYVRARIAWIKQRLGDMSGYVGDAAEQLDPETELAFLEHILAIEQGPTTTHAHQLIEMGIRLPPPEEMDDAALSQKLWEVIHGLARVRVFLEHTDHLTDRELYSALWYDALNEMTIDMSMCANGATHLPMLDEQDEQTWLAFYATPEDRRTWARENPAAALPPRRATVSDRDRHLPSPYD